MAGPGGTNEIVVRIVSGLKGDGDDVVRKTRERAKKVRDTELKEKETTEKAKERIDQAAARAKERAEQKQRDDAVKSRERAQKKERESAIKHEEKLVKDAQKAREKAEKDEAKRKAAAQKKEAADRSRTFAQIERAREQVIKKQEREREQAARKAARQAERESPEYLQRAGYMGARARILRKQGAEAYLREQGIEPKAAKAKAVPLTYAQRRARAAAERNQYLAETYGSVEEGQRQERTQRARSAFASRGAYEAEGRRHILSGGTGRPWYSIGGKISESHMSIGDQMSAVAQVATSNPYLKTIIAAAMAVYKSAKSVYDMAVPVGKEGVAMNRSFGRAQAELAGMENPQARTYNIHGRRYIQAAAMGRSPTDLLRARAASLRGAGGGVSDIETLALMVNAQMGAGDAAGMMSMSMMRGKQGGGIKKDINQMFAIGIAAGFKEIARQPIFARSFAEYMSKAHVTGATTPGIGQLVATLSAAGGAGGTISGLYGLDVINKLQSGMAGPDPMSSKAAFMRYAMGYGRPGSTLDFFQAEELRRGGIMNNPQALKTVLGTLRGVTRGSERQMAYMLVNLFGLEQKQANELLKVNDILPAPEGGEDKFSPGKAAARTPEKAKYYARQDLKLAQATTELTYAFDRLRNTTIKVVEQNQGILKITPNVLTGWLNKWLGAGTETGEYTPFAEHKKYSPIDVLSPSQNEAALKQERAKIRVMLARHPDMPESDRAQYEARANQISNILFENKMRVVTAAGGANIPAAEALALASQRTAASASDIALSKKKQYDQEAKARVEAAKKAEKESAGPMSALPQNNAATNAINQHFADSSKKAAQAMTEFSIRVQTPSVPTPAGGKGQFQPPATPAP